MPPTITCNLRSLMRQWQADHDRDLTFQDLAEQTGKGERTLRRWASNQVTSYDAAVLVALCTFFDVGLADVLTLNGKEAQN